MKATLMFSLARYALSDDLRALRHETGVRFISAKKSLHTLVGLSGDRCATTFVTDPRTASAIIEDIWIHRNMAGRDLQGLIALDTLSPSDKIYQGVNKDDWLLFRSNLIYQKKESIYPITKRLLIALALTKVYYDVKKGKIIWFAFWHW